MTYEDQLGGLAARIASVREEITAEVQKIEGALHGRIDSAEESLEQMAATLSNHMSSTFNIVNEARDVTRSFEQRLQVLERLVLSHFGTAIAPGVAKVQDDAGNQATDRDVQSQDTAGGDDSSGGVQGDGGPVQGSEGDSVGEGGGESQSQEGTQDKEGS